MKTKIVSSFAGFAIVVLLITLFFSSSMIRPGYVGIMVNAYGDQKGVEDYPVYTGRVWYNPLTTSVFDYPTFTQNAVWAGQEKISFNTSEGSRVSCDVGLSYRVDPARVPHIFVRHRQELEYITHNWLRTKARDAMNQHSAEFTSIEILGAKSQQLLAKAKAELAEELLPEGFIIDTLSFISAPEPEDPSVKQSITRVIASTQQAMEAENKVRQFEAEARQQEAKSRGTANSILTEAKAQAEANLTLSESITPKLIQYKAIEKWNGQAPNVLGSDFSVLLNQESK